MLFRQFLEPSVFQSFSEITYRVCIKTPPQACRSVMHTDTALINIDLYPASP